MLLYNAIKCPDGTLLVSRHQHDFQMHRQKDGREYFVDGGLAYQRIGHSDTEYINLSVYTHDLHEKIREHFDWIRHFDKDMNKLPQPEIIKLKDITDEHLMKLVEWTDTGFHKEIHKVFVDEVEYRNQ